MTAKMLRHAVLCSAALACSLSALAGDEPLARRFASPPAESRILKIIHSWPDDARAQDELIHRLSQQGFGGVVCNVSFDSYLESEAKWQALQRAVTEAKKAGWALWLYDEKGYPSGKAGGIVLKGHPQWEASGLLTVETTTTGRAVSLALPPGALLLAQAFPVRNQQIDPQGKVDLSRSVCGGHLQWQPPKGDGTWQVLAVTRDHLYKGTHCETNFSDRLPYPNLLMAEPTKRFLEVTHGRYASHLGPDLGKLFVSTFTDEPSLINLFMKPMPYRVLPWSPGLPAEFQSRRGYALEPIIPDLVLDAGARGRKHRYDFWLTIAELVSENYFGQIQQWCHQHQFRSGGHLLMEESLTAHVPLYGDFLRCARRLDAPSIDCLTSLPPEVPWFIARLMASAAELEKKSVVMCETSDFGQVYRSPEDKRPVRHVTEAEIRGTCNRLMVGGVNCITSYYSFAGLDDESLRRLNNWVGRCATMLTGGHQVADIALVYPVQSVWPRFVPSHEWTREAHEAARIEAIYRDAMNALFRSRRDFTIVDTRSLAEAKVTKAALTHGELKWRVVVLPGVDTLPLAAWENLARFVREGGVLISLGSLPASSEAEFPSPRVQALTHDIFGSVTDRPCSQANPNGGGGVFLPAGSADLLPVAIDGILDPDVKVQEAGAPLRVTHRRIDHHEVYFVINDSPDPWQGEVQFAAAGSCEIWHPASGLAHPVNPGRPVVLALEPHGAAIVRYAAPAPSARRQLNSGQLPRWTMKPLPDVPPTIHHGTFVAAELHKAPAPVQAERSSYDVIGRLTKSHVDTYLFARFHYNTPQVLDPLGCVVIDVRVVEGKKTAPTFLVILHEEGGGEFIAETGVSLGASGQELLIIPISRFQPAGWSHEGDGVLDTSRVSDVSMGWGGYFGTNGEVVRFQVTSPAWGSAANH